MSNFGRVLLYISKEIQKRCHVLGFACSMLGKSSKNILPNDGGEKW